MNTTKASVAGFILRATHREETAAFYRALGLTAHEDKHEGPVHFELGPTDPACVAEIYKQTKNFPTDALMIRTDDIAATLDVLGVTEECKDVGDLRLIYIKDPDDRVVMLYQVIENHEEEDSLAQQRCLPCGDGIPPLSQETIDQHLYLLNDDWLKESEYWYIADGKIEKIFAFKNFSESVRFVQKIEPIAETEDHHPDIHIEQYKMVRITLITHAINALSINDFIIAAKIDAIVT